MEDSHVQEQQAGNDASATAIVTPEGRFDYDRRLEFKAPCMRALADPAVRTIVVDLARTTHIDSAALGMLLLRKEDAAAAGKRLVLRGATGVVADVLKVARFDLLFAEG